MKSILRIAVMGFVAVASTMSITMVSVAPASAAASPPSSDIANDPPGEEVAPPPLPEGALDGAPSEQTPPSGEVSLSGYCYESENYCKHAWYDSRNFITDLGLIRYGGPTVRWWLYSCNWNSDNLSIGLQIDPSDGGWSYYTKGDATRGEDDGDCAADFTEKRKIRKLRFVAVDRAGQVVGTPTDWIEPPGGAGPP